MPDAHCAPPRHSTSRTRRERAPYVQRWGRAHPPRSSTAPPSNPLREKEGVPISTAYARPAGATLTNGPAPDLAVYDVVLVNVSGGKDSQLALEVTVQAARAAGVVERVVVVHADLGEAEWPGTRELAEEHAAHYGVRFEVVARHASGAVETILERVEARGMWPDAARRWCTSDHKRGPVRTLMTRLAGELRESGTVTDRPVRILNVMGMRAQESRARARKSAYAHDASASNGRRHVDEWRPIHGFSEDDVWARIQAAGTRPHWAYREGMSRLSCRFCVLASKQDLVCSARLNPELAADYAAVEARIGHRFRKDVSMAEIIEQANQTTPATPEQPTLW